jgi:hypothetical protein
LKVQSRPIVFEVANIMSEDGRQIISNFLQSKGHNYASLCVCLSLTMWIHLHHRDEGLNEFLCYLCGISHNLLIEPQPWKCYKVRGQYVTELKLSFFC